jgi:hypothetical protein
MSKAYATVPAGNFVKETSNKSRMASSWSDTLWQDWQRLVAQRKACLASQNLSTFFMDMGRVGYATRGCTVGDIVCEFDTGSDQLKDGTRRGPVAIIDNTYSTCRVIGKGIVRYSQSAEYEEQERIGRMKWLHKELDVEVHLDMATLLYLNGCF